MSNLAEPVYRVITAQQNIEVRHYEPMIIAEVEMQGKREVTISEGFRLIAVYIFSNNTVKQTIPMTAPVQQQSTGQSWQVSFVMPAEYSLENLPKPNDKRIRLRQIPAKKFIAIKFAGTYSNKNLAKHEKQLMNYIEAKQINIIGSPKYAFYNPPWTPG